MPDTVEAQNAVGVSGLSSEGGFEVEAADGEAVDASGNVDGLFPFVLRFAEWAPMKTSADFEAEAAKGFDAWLEIAVDAPEPSRGLYKGQMVDFYFFFFTIIYMLQVK